MVIYHRGAETITLTNRKRHDEPNKYNTTANTTLITIAQSANLKVFVEDSNSAFRKHRGHNLPLTVSRKASIKKEMLWQLLQVIALCSCELKDESMVFIEVL